MSRTLLIHWGRTGSGPRILQEVLTEALALSKEVAISYSKQADIAAAFDVVDVPALKFGTYTTKWGYIWRVATAGFAGPRLRRFIRDNDISRVVSVMEGVYQSLVVPVWIDRRTEYVTVIHDFSFHPGDGNLVRVVNRYLELRRADRVLVLNSLAAAEARQHRLLRGKEIVKRSHPAFRRRDDDESWHNTTQANQTLRIGFFGRIERYKGIELFLELAEIAASRDANFTFCIVGDGSFVPNLPSPPPPNVEIDARWLPDGEIDRTVGSFDVLVLPYTSASQSGVFAHALTLGVPVVATPVGGLSEQLAEVPGFGILAKEASATALYDALVQLTDSPEALAAASRAGIAASQTSHSWTDFTEALFD